MAAVESMVVEDTKPAEKPVDREKVRDLSYIIINIHNLKNGGFYVILGLKCLFNLFKCVFIRNFRRARCFCEYFVQLEDIIRQQNMLEEVYRKTSYKYILGRMLP